MNILLITPQLPYPPHQGTTIRNFSLIRYLASKHTIDLFTFGEKTEQLDASHLLYRYCRRIEIVAAPQRTTGQRLKDSFLSPLPDMALRLESAEMRALIERAADAIDGNVEGRYALVQSEGIEVAQYALWLQRQSPSNAKPKFVFDDHNCEYLLQKRNALTDLRRLSRWPAAAYSLVQWQKLRSYEAAVCRAADAVTVVSQADKIALQKIAPTVAATVVSNGIDLQEYIPQTLGVTADPVTADPVADDNTVDDTVEQILVFTGKMDYRPNVDAVLWFGKYVLPRITEEAPDVRFQIVGMNPHPRLDELRSNEHIEIVGAVDEIAPYIQQAAVYVIPLRVGGGTRFKALEAMAMGKAIVSTSLGVEGIPIGNGRELVLADEPDAFAQSVLALLADQRADGKRTLSLGQEARAFVESHYDWQQIMPLFDTIYEDILDDSQSG